MLPKKPQIQVELQDWMGDDRAIANAAWTSSYDHGDRDHKTLEDVERVIKYMAKHKHGTPFESVVFRFWFRWPIFTDRQHMTHRMASHNGLSGRYRTLPSDFYTLPKEVQETVKKGMTHLHGTDKYVQGWLRKYEKVCSESYQFYSEMIGQLKSAEKEGAITNDEYKRAREVFRGVLGTSFMVERTTVMNLRSFANYMKLRNSDHAQPEIRLAAQQMLMQVIEEDICPMAIMALESEGWQI